MCITHQKKQITEKHAKNNSPRRDLCSTLDKNISQKLVELVIRFSIAEELYTNLSSAMLNL